MLCRSPPPSSVARSLHVVRGGFQGLHPRPPLIVATAGPNSNTSTAQTDCHLAAQLGWVCRRRSVCRSQFNNRSAVRPGRADFAVVGRSSSLKSVARGLFQGSHCRPPSTAVQQYVTCCKNLTGSTARQASRSPQAGH